MPDPPTSSSGALATAFERLRERNVIRLVRQDGNAKFFRLTREAIHRRAVFMTAGRRNGRIDLTLLGISDTELLALVDDLADENGWTPHHRRAPATRREPRERRRRTPIGRRPAPVVDEALRLARAARSTTARCAADRDGARDPRQPRPRQGRPRPPSPKLNPAQRLKLDPRDRASRRDTAPRRSRPRCAASGNATSTADEPLGVFTNEELEELLNGIETQEVVHYTPGVDEPDPPLRNERAIRLARQLRARGRPPRRRNGSTAWRT